MPKSRLSACGIRALVVCCMFLPTAHAQDRDQSTEHALTDFDLRVEINPDTHKLEVEATIELPQAYAGETVEFLLTDAVDIISAEPSVERLPYEGSQGFTGINGSSVDLTDQGHVARYRVTVPAENAQLKIRYQGVINFALGGQKEQYTRGFQSTAGIVGEEGIFLAGSSLWYPYFSNELVAFRLESNVPAGWHLISQGNGSSRDESDAAAWDSAGAVDEIYLVGGPLVKYSEPAGSVAAEVYLHERDDALAQKYLTATAQYLEMYRNLIGPYPYGKFALVENFWETGYGMPSFTLLGPQVIRFPFILTSSYPHEVLHNWWGNSVFVDYDTGNWCEGLTAYMADHLMQELRGTGMNWRRDTLKKYRDFVSEEKDFPLTEFRSRHSAATEAIGYGKVAMGFHMLRRELGDEQFTQALQRFYRSNRGQQASFGDVRSAFEATSEKNYETFFEQWVNWTGAPDIRAEDVAVESDGKGGYLVTGMLAQRQEGDAYQISVPVYVSTEAGLETFQVNVAGKSDAFRLETEGKPVLLEIDPEFDMFRLLDPRETAPSIGQIFGESEILVVLPSRADKSVQEAYAALVDNWRSDAHDIEIVFDNEIKSIPADRAAWLLGSKNRLASKLFGREPAIDVEFSVDALFIAGEAVEQADHSTVIVRRHPENVSKAIGWIAVDPGAAFSGMASKLPHYGKYSYLAFEGDEPANMLKGEWAATDSPLRVDLRANKSSFDGPAMAAAAPARAALAELPPVFSRDRLTEHVQNLAGEAMAGRGLGTPGLELAADYIVEQFQQVGLAPGGDNDTYSQVFRVAEGEDGQPHDVRNIIGVLPGNDPALADQMLLVTAHYDHLGSGWPDKRAAAGDGIYYGADDNASGVAVLIELARNLASEAKPARTIVFVAFTAEEAGRLGSKYFADNPLPLSLESVNAVVNMDTVGQLGDKAISVFGGSSANEWQHIFRGVDFTTGIKSALVLTELDSSDQQSFIDKGIPGVQISSGASLDYHRPSDTVDRIDADGLTKVAVFVKETVVYLATRPEPLTVTIDISKPAPMRAPAGQSTRRVSVGTVPDFAFVGAGVRVGGIVPGSPAEQAGLQEGDILVAIDGKAVDNLQGFTDLLKTYAPGQRVKLKVLRDDTELAVDATLVAR